MKDKLDIAASEYMNIPPVKAAIKYGDVQDLESHIKVAFRNGAQWRLDNMWIPVKEELPNVGISVFVLTENGNIAVSKMYIPKDCKGNILGDKQWKGPGSFRDSIMAWMHKPTFKKGE